MIEFESSGFVYPAETLAFVINRDKEVPPVEETTGYITPLSCIVYYEDGSFEELTIERGGCRTYYEDIRNESYLCT
jgi:hypothetical protein